MNTAVLDPAGREGINPDELDPLVKPFWKARELRRVGFPHERAVLAAIHAGEIPAVRVGRKLLVPTAWVRKAMGLDELTHPPP